MSILEFQEVPSAATTFEANGDGEFHELSTRVSVQVGRFDSDEVSAETVEGLPIKLVEAYAAIAVRHARVREVDPGVWVATVAGLDGAWAEGDSFQGAEMALHEAIIGWVAVKRRVGAADIPAIEGIDLNVSTRRDST